MSTTPRPFYCQNCLLCVYPSPDRISTERGSKTNRAVVVPELYKLLSVSYYIIPSLLLATLSLWRAGYLILSVPTDQRVLHRHAGLLSLILGWRILDAVLKLTHFTQGTFKVCLYDRGLSILPQFLFPSVDTSSYPSTLACGLKPTTLNRLHERTQTNRTRRFTVASVYLVADAPKYFSLGKSRALSSTAMVGLNYEPFKANWLWWIRLESNQLP